MSTNSPDTRTKILRATIDLLLAKDGSGTRMTDVAKRAGVSRQAVYLHFDNRGDLLIAATQHLDEILGTDARLAPSRAARSGVERLDAFILAWGNYIPEIYGIAKALIDMGRTDSAAFDAWAKRMQDMREGCQAAIDALKSDGTLTPELTTDESTDILWTLLSVGTWENSTITCGWSQKKYIELTTRIARQLFYRSV